MKVGICNRIVQLDFVTCSVRLFWVNEISWKRDQKYTCAQASVSMDLVATNNILLLLKQIVALVALGTKKQKK